MKGLDLCQQYFEEFGRPMLTGQFPDFQARIAAGLVGPGSECYGFDDELSVDHDYGPSFCLWLTNEDFDAIGAPLQSAYDRLPASYRGHERIATKHGNGRVGVFRIDDFYKRYTGKADAALSLTEWLHIPEHFLAEATNGRVFRDPSGVFSNIRTHLLSYYPDDVRIKKIAAKAANMAQSGQYNYARSMSRSEIVAARLALDEFIRNTLSMTYLLNRIYQPYYKWAHRGMHKFMVLTELQQLIQELVYLPVQDHAWRDGYNPRWKTSLNKNDQIAVKIEHICVLIVRELRNQGLTDQTDPFLENHTSAIMSHIQNDTLRSMHVMVG